MEVARFEHAIARHGEDFLLEFLLPSELTYRRPRLLPMSAVQFAAKEAFFKALGTGKRARMSWHDLRVRSDGPPADGRLAIDVSGETARLTASLGLRRTHLSWGSTGGPPELVVAMVFLES